MRDTDANNCNNLNVIATQDVVALLVDPGDNPMRQGDTGVVGSARFRSDSMVALLGSSASDLTDH